MSQSRYEKRGVSATKAEVHAAVADQDKGLFPGAFCKIIEDLAGHPDYCMAVHADGAGTKSSLAYVAWKEGLGLDVWKGIAQDSLVMNLDDLGCVGARGPFFVSNTIGRNSKLVPGEVIASIVAGYQEFCDRLSNRRMIPCQMVGGETADVGDLVRTIIVDSTVVTRMYRDRVVDANRMVPGDVIVGFSSTGQACWEDVPNSGIGSNGLTSARHDSLMELYGIKYRESFAPEMDPELVYCGKYKLRDPLPGDDRFTIGSALLSPTRTYLPLMKGLMEQMSVSDLHGLIHCSGGGQTKIGKFGRPGNLYMKETLFPVPPLFAMLQKATGQTWKEMYQVYNMGHRLEAVVPRKCVDVCRAVARACHIDNQVVGYVTDGGKPGENVVICTQFGTFTY